MSSTEPEPITKADLQALADGLDELRERFDDLDAARTPAERQEASQQVTEAKADLAATAAALGVSEETLRGAVKSARDAERKDELRGPLKELLQEIRDEEEAAARKAEEDAAAEAAANGTKPKPKAAKPKSEPGAPDPAPVVEDTEPVKPHWGERSVSELLR